MARGQFPYKSRGIQDDRKLTIKATERQNAAPFTFEVVYSSYSASKKWRSASVIAKR